MITVAASLHLPYIETGQAPLDLPVVDLGGPTRALGRKLVITPSWVSPGGFHHPSPESAEAHRADPARCARRAAHDSITPMNSRSPPPVLLRPLLRLVRSCATFRPHSMPEHGWKGAGHRSTLDHETELHAPLHGGSRQVGRRDQRGSPVDDDYFGVHSQQTPQLAAWITEANRDWA